MTLKTIAYRLPQDLIEKIDAYAAKRAARDGRPCSRSVAIRMLLEKGLDLETRGSRRSRETAWSESLTGKITDTFESPPNKKKKTSIDAYAAKRAAAFEEAKKKRPGV